ncbi:hypothetical protein [Streptomyces sp. HC307]|uniref:hypothetical protein n=1 Tax=Streptomyces flavusporus TaxID=3385496 RepID=UPI0039170EC8
MQGSGTGGQHDTDLLVAAPDRWCSVDGAAFTVDAGEELDEIAGSRTGRHDAALVVAVLSEEEILLVLLLVLVDLGQEAGLGSAWS